MAEPQISPQLQQEIAKLQGMNAQLQSLMQQRGQFDMMKAEAEQAVEALSALAAGATVYRNVGALFLQEPDKDAALARLKDEKETLEVRVGRLAKQETALKESMQALQKKIQAALPKA